MQTCPQRKLIKEAHLRGFPEPMYQVHSRSQNQVRVEVRIIGIERVWTGLGPNSTQARAAGSVKAVKELMKEFEVMTRREARESRRKLEKDYKSRILKTEYNRLRRLYRATKRQEIQQQTSWKQPLPGHHRGQQQQPLRQQPSPKQPSQQHQRRQQEERQRDEDRRARRERDADRREKRIRSWEKGRELRRQKGRDGWDYKRRNRRSRSSERKE